MNSMAIAAISTRADQAGGGIANDAVVLHARGHDITGAEERADDDVLREGKQPFHQW